MTIASPNRSALAARTAFIGFCAIAAVFLIYDTVHVLGVLPYLLLLACLLMQVFMHDGNGAHHPNADGCIAYSCNLDYALAELHEGGAVRTKTLACGDDRCDFRIKARRDSKADAPQSFSSRGNLLQRRRLSLSSDPNNVVS